MTDVERELVMGAFWEAHNAAAQRDPMRVESYQFALHLAPLIRGNGIASYENANALNDLECREANVRLRIEQAASLLSELARVSEGRADGLGKELKRRAVELLEMLPGKRNG